MSVAVTPQPPGRTPHTRSGAPGAEDPAPALLDCARLRHDQARY